MVQVLFFGMIVDKVGKQQVQAESGQSLAALIEQLGCSRFQPLLVAVNQEQVNDMSLIVNDGDEVALMPPFSGG